VPDAETLLLVDDDKPQILEDYVARDQPVRSYDYIDRAVRYALGNTRLLLVRAEP
jgi:hypothetical protein